MIYADDPNQAFGTGLSAPMPQYQPQMSNHPPMQFVPPDTGPGGGQSIGGSISSAMGLAKGGYQGGQWAKGVYDSMGSSPASSAPVPANNTPTGFDLPSMAPSTMSAAAPAASAAAPAASGAATAATSGVAGAAGVPAAGPIMSLMQGKKGAAMGGALGLGAGALLAPFTGGLSLVALPALGGMMGGQSDEE